MKNKTLLYIILPIVLFFGCKSKQKISSDFHQQTKSNTERLYTSIDTSTMITNIKKETITLHIDTAIYLRLKHAIFQSNDTLNIAPIKTIIYEKITAHKEQNNHISIKDTIYQKTKSEITGKKLEVYKPSSSTKIAALLFCLFFSAIVFFYIKWKSR